MSPKLLLSFLALTVVACSDEVDDASTGATGSGGGTGGMTTSSAGGGGSGGSASVMCGPEIDFTSYFGCDVDALTDGTGESEVTIGYGFVDNAFIYEPKCLHVCAGTTVTFEPLDGTNFQIHPLQGGEPPGDPDSPFGYIGSADETTASFTLTEPGSYPYYCIAHLGSDMTGVVYVQ
jgi:plastocyanin